jgi:hypothetical protein
MQIQYVGSDGWNQNDDRQINTLPLNSTHREAVANGSTNSNLWRQYLGYNNIRQEENEVNFNYNSFQAGLRMENRHGLTTQLAYTWSHLIDIGQNDLNQLSNPFNAKYDRGSDTGYDKRHIFNASYVYNLPFYRTSHNYAKRAFLGGWTISGITQATSGTPIRVNYTGTNTLGLGGGTSNRPDLVSKVSYPKTVNKWFSTSSFANPVAPWNGGTNQGFGTAGKDSMVGPGLFLWNLSLFKTIPFTGRENGPALDLRFESFNTFNHPSWTGVNISSADGNFGQVTSDYGPRTLELGGKITF